MYATLFIDLPCHSPIFPFAPPSMRKSAQGAAAVILVDPVIKDMAC